MQKDSEEIEVEVVEIDGEAPIITRSQDDRIDPDEGSAFGGWRNTSQWQGRVRRLDSRWWPLWVLLGIIALILLLTLGVVFAVIYLIIRTIRRIIVAIFR
jgi:hypothetical protein